MKKHLKKIGFIILLLSICSSFAVPIMQMIKYEDILKNGQSLKFNLIGFDPYDIFRGRFVNIQLDINSIKLDKTMTRDELLNNVGFNNKRNHPLFGYRNKPKGYLAFETDKNGYAKLVNFNTNKDNLKGIIANGYWSTYQVDYQKINKQKTNYNSVTAYSPKLDLTRFYMNENIAKSAEKILQNNNLRDRCYVVVKVKNYIPIIENIYIKSTNNNAADMTIREYIYKQKKH